MFNRLRRRFIILATAALLALLLLIIGSATVVNYYTLVRNGDRTQEALERRDFNPNKPVKPDMRPDGPEMRDGPTPEEIYRARYTTFILSTVFTSLIAFVGFVIIFIIIVIYSKRLIRPVAEAYDKQKQFISMAGHELRTPITIIDADAQVLEADLPEGNEWLSDITTQTGRMAELTNELLNLTRMDEGRGLSMIDFSISDVCEEAVKSFEAVAGMKHRHIEARIEGGLSLHGDEPSIRRLVEILIDNAVKYSTAEAISFALYKDKKSTVITVSNEAANLDPAALPHLFERFCRGEMSGNTKTGGYGLGLAIARATADAHKAKITAALHGSAVMEVTCAFPQ